MTDLPPPNLSDLFDRYAPQIYAYLARRVGNDIADDLLSVTFLTALRQRDRFDASRGEPLPWLYGIATNVLRRHRRDEVRRWRNVARVGVETHAPSLVDEVISRVDAQAATQNVAAELARMPRRDRDALLLFAWSELSYEQIATALDVPIGTVRSRIHRARTRLRKTLPGQTLPTNDGLETQPWTN